MKIIKQGCPETLEKNKRIANEGCDRCPCCKTGLNVFVKRIGCMKTNIIATSRTWYGYKDERIWLFSKERDKGKHHWKVDKYYCRSCGCSWESEPYITSRWLDENE